MTAEALDHRLSRRVLIEFRRVVLNVDVVADAEELLVILVAARQQHSSDTNDIRHGEARRIRSITLVFTKHCGQYSHTQKRWHQK